MQTLGTVFKLKDGGYLKKFTLEDEWNFNVRLLNTQEITDAMVLSGAEKSAFEKSGEIERIKGALAVFGYEAQEVEISINEVCQSCKI